jgi:hypothetical protein
VERVLAHDEYARQGQADEGLLPPYGEKTTGLSRAREDSEYISYDVSRLPGKLLIEQTKSRPRHSNGNGLVEARNGAVIRKHLGCGYGDRQTHPTGNRKESGGHSALTSCSSCDEKLLPLCGRPTFRSPPLKRPGLRRVVE